MLVLGIESSCDETGVAIVEADTHGVPTLLADALHSQIDLHADYGGVVPELASRDHVRRVVPLLRQALAAADLGVDALDMIAYTRGPGLAGALLVGAGVAAGLASALDTPLLGVHHLEGHLLSPFLDRRPGASVPAMPFIALLVSGGHTQLLQVRNVGDYTLLGDTIDDAAGEAYDKTAKLLGLGYPGGAALARLAERGDPHRHRLPRPLWHRAGHDFSFAGLKTAAATALRRMGDAPSDRDRADLAAGVQEAITDVLVHKTVAATEAAGLGEIVVAGGVGANARLRAALGDACSRRGWRLHFPPLALCSDNGAMIAMAAALRWQRGLTADLRRDGAFDVLPRWPLAVAGQGGERPSDAQPMRSSVAPVGTFLASTSSSTPFSTRASDAD